LDIKVFGFNLVTIFVKKKFGKVIIFLNLVVLFLSLNNLQRWLIDNDFVSGLFLIQQLEVPWYLLIFPMFYAFVTHFLKIEDRVNDFIKVTFFIFVIEIVIRLCLISYVYYEEPNLNDSLIEKYTRIEEMTNLFYCVFLFINTCLIIFTKHHLIGYILDFDDLNWVKWFIRFGVLILVLWVFAIIVKSSTANEMAYIPLRVGTSILLYWIGYQGFYKYNVVHDRILLRSSIETNQVLIESGDIQRPHEKTDDFYNEKHHSDFNRIKNHIIKKKLYLDPLLSMESLASEFNMSKSYFSKLINSYSDYNFSDFINFLRVKQAKKFLSNKEFSEYTIVAIGLECGFNSKSTFYASFKKFTSETPTTFREQFYKIY
jgi:AraC-like DNA-binding protein